MKTKSTRFISKLGTAKGSERSRIWIEGNRLIDAGFKHGTKYSQHWTPTTLTLSCENSSDVGRLVSGKGDKPIIDIVGAKVRETFGDHCEQVEVAYSYRRIIIRRA